MVNLDVYWQSNEDWYHFDENGDPVISVDAPNEAWESYQHYLEQVNSSAL